MKIKLLPKDLCIPKRNCKRCALYKTREYICFGTGPGSKCNLIFVGEAPGSQENSSGIVFCGKAGQFISKMLNMLKVPRNKLNFLNILKCQPPNNRNPLLEEVEACLPFLHRQIKKIKPDLIVALGKVACTHLTGFSESVVQNHGNLYPYIGDESIDVMFTFHPAFIIRPNGSKYKTDFIRDINNALKFVGLK